MGLTAGSVGIGAIDGGMRRRLDGDYVVALAGNPNVGKSTVFNALTGLNQHTGNWPGKTVSGAWGTYHFGGKKAVIADLPGTYSLISHSAEEEVARDFICSGEADAVVVVCDATCLERNLNLVLQTLEITGNVVICVNLMDEARRKGIHVDIEKLSSELGVPVAAVSARSGRGLKKLMEIISFVALAQKKSPLIIPYPDHIEHKLIGLCGEETSAANGAPGRWLALRRLESEESCEFCDMIVGTLMKKAAAIAAAVVSGESGYSPRDRRFDSLLTGRRTGIPIMLFMIGFIFWITIWGANIPSGLLADGLFRVGSRLSALLCSLGTAEWLRGMIVDGVYRVLAWVVSVMLPPMAIFFPIFTLLEDSGFLPRIAFNMDHYFKKACACGKQALTICMGFGCNAAGVVGCRIIDSKRERLIAMVTNSLVPCNGRFPMIISLITIFFIGIGGGIAASVGAAVILTLFILLGILVTLLASKLLSATLLKGESSSFMLELPPYRRPQIGKVIVRSILDRTIFVLGRAAAVAAPAGLLIWCMANINAGGDTLLAHCAGFLDPFGRFLGMDGVILLAFILGFPANEIVIPIILMSYMATGIITDVPSLSTLRELLSANGWTPVTAVCTILFSLFHWPCSTTCITIKKESGSLKWTAVSVILPTAIGMCLCAAVAAAARLFQAI